MLRELAAVEVGVAAAPRPDFVEAPSRAQPSALETLKPAAGVSLRAGTTVKQGPRPPPPAPGELAMTRAQFQAGARAAAQAERAQQQQQGGRGV